MNSNFFADTVKITVYNGLCSTGLFFGEFFFQRTFFPGIFFLVPLYNLVPIRTLHHSRASNNKQNFVYSSMIIHGYRVFSMYNTNMIMQDLFSDWINGSAVLIWKKITKSFIVISYRSKKDWKNCNFLIYNSFIHSYFIYNCIASIYLYSPDLTASTKQYWMNEKKSWHRSYLQQRKTKCLMTKSIYVLFISMH